VRQTRGKSRYTSGLYWKKTDPAERLRVYFKTGALNHSATLPSLRHQSFSGSKIKNGVAIEAKLDPCTVQASRKPAVSA
jgi:hypothetical protein